MQKQFFVVPSATDDVDSDTASYGETEVFEDTVPDVAVRWSWVSGAVTGGEEVVECWIREAELLDENGTVLNEEESTYRKYRVGITGMGTGFVVEKIDYLEYVLGSGAEDEPL